MSKQPQKAGGTSEKENEELRNLLENYIRRSEELEQKESSVMKQIELMQSAVSFLQQWNKSQKSMTESQESERLDLEEIEKETMLIREETKRIQKEVKQKQEENRKLQEEVNNRKRLQSSTEDFLPADNSKKRREKKNVDNRVMRDSDSRVAISDSGVDFFDEKLEKLREAEKKLKKESELQTEEARNKQKQQNERLESLEWESRMNKQQIDSLRKKTDKK